jgi:hypothetical protein
MHDFNISPNVINNPGNDGYIFNIVEKYIKGKHNDNIEHDEARTGLHSVQDYKKRSEIVDALIVLKGGDVLQDASAVEELRKRLMNLSKDAFKAYENQLKVDNQAIFGKALSTMKDITKELHNIHKAYKNAQNLSGIDAIKRLVAKSNDQSESGDRQRWFEFLSKRVNHIPKADSGGAGAFSETLSKKLKAIVYVDKNLWRISNHVFYQTGFPKTDVFDKFMK